ncbi:MAG: hypothetical protein FWH11_09530 [Micrococcales bacterium]|nr:hypothetical protein [Micrococcales bacterium]
MNGTGNSLQELLASTPWSRLMTAYSRATDFPEMARKVADGTADQATFEQIADDIEQQDTLFQASPYMVDVLIKLLDCPEADVAAILSILKTVYVAALDKYLSTDHIEEPEISLEDDLLPPFVDEDDDEELFEEWDSDNWLYWHQLCLGSIEAARERIESYKVDGPAGDAALVFFEAAPLGHDKSQQQVEEALARLRSAPRT